MKSAKLEISGCTLFLAECNKTGFNEESKKGGGGCSGGAETVNQNINRKPTHVFGQKTVFNRKK